MGFARWLAANALALLVVLGLVLAGLLGWAWREFERPGPLVTDTVFEVKAGDRLWPVSERLEQEGIVRSARVFRIGARLVGKANALKRGEYAIPARASMRAVLDILTSGRALARRITIPEGLTSWQVVERLKAAEGLAGTIGEIPPEGWLAPDTYDYVRGTARQTLIERMMERQRKILAEAWEKRDPDLPLKSPEEALILASIIEKETGKPEERPIIASVFVNRLRKGMRLQTDPTVIYGITGGKGPLGRGLRVSELKRRTPYNTYVITGLPPTPIANPGRDAIWAATHPAKTDYLYFVADGTGGHVFARSNAEHAANVRKWRRIEKERQRAQKTR